MATVTGLTYEQARAKQSELKKQGKTASTSKEYGKLEDYIKTLKPQNYGSKTVASAQAKLATSTQLPGGTSGGLTSGSSASPGMAGGSAGQPTIDLNKMYEDSINSPEMKALESELLAKKQARDEAEGDVNDNPFYSEATRVGKLAKLDEKALDEIQTLESTMQQKKADAQVKINIATQQYNIESDQYKNNLSKLNTLISTGALSNASGADLAQIAQATGMSVEMVKGIQQKMVEDKVKPTVINSTDDNGNVTVSVIDANTGKIISQNSLGSIGNKQNAGGGDSISPQEKAFDSSIQNGIGQLQKGESWGTVWNRVKSMFPDVPDVLIDYGLGLEWKEGGAYETFRDRQ